ncbi:hypothetical protein BOX15_Mlig029306g2 [Macrostomum lignano]|uniref:Uncharacterized protein n=1 Tax=Macrostomum lignano TaxID=282301 RepID=A0A267E705_9PLAT|nr:hypothetical protein BOX15_Mlig029306g4 [Macrostomum lignano]PAA57373.1 hypothetical protein BOX15_Mlig029306g2 [Macrostomum lignano]
MKKMKELVLIVGGFVMFLLFICVYCCKKAAAGCGRQRTGSNPNRVNVQVHPPVAAIAAGEGWPTSSMLPPPQSMQQQHQQQYQHQQQRQFQPPPPSYEEATRNGC